MKNDKPLVGVSRCLLGDAVRYDGQSKLDLIVIEQLSKIFELIPVCPEVEAGLPVPRPPVLLSGSIDNPRLTGRNDPQLDITDIMQAYCQRRTAQLDDLAGFIFKSRSPSCGLNSTPVFIDGQCVTETGRGVFSNALIKACPKLPVIEDTQLEDPEQLQDFIHAVKHGRRGRNQFTNCRC